MTLSEVARILKTAVRGEPVSTEAFRGALREALRCSDVLLQRMRNEAVRDLCAERGSAHDEANVDHVPDGLDKAQRTALKVVSASPDEAIGDSPDEGSPDADHQGKPRGGKS